MSDNNRLSFIDQIKYIVDNPREWPKNHGSLAVNGGRYEEIKNSFCPSVMPSFPFMGCNIHVDDTVPPNEIRFVSWVRDPATNEYVPRVDRIINIGDGQ